MEESKIALEDNTLTFRPLPSGVKEGVNINQEEKQYLLPHFLMLLIGKPASGKTTLLRQLLTNPQMYNKKFNHVIMVSPSYAKMGLDLKQDNCQTRFSLGWIFKRIEEINGEQHEKIYGHSKGGGQVPGDKVINGVQITNTALVNDPRSRFEAGPAMQKMGVTNRQTLQANNSLLGQMRQLASGTMGYANSALPGQTTMEDIMDQQEQMYQLQQQQAYKDIEEMEYKRRMETQTNVLIVLDDVVSQIKKQEFNPLLSRLIMNRRHLVLNGTVSIIIVSQKYTLIPARLRSNASWLILFQLNPIDFENVYKDAIVHNYKLWQRLLQYVFGDDYDKAAHDDETSRTVKKRDQKEDEKLREKKYSTIDELVKAKRFENLGIWVELNIYFKNFKRIVV